MNTDTQPREEREKSLRDELADARQLAADPDGSSVLWIREVTGWRKAEDADERV